MSVTIIPKTVKVTFHKVSIKHTFRWTDRTGKKRQVTREFMQTLNPFNKNKEGNVKTREEIMAELRADRDKWIQERVAEVEREQTL